MDMVGNWSSKGKGIRFVQEISFELIRSRRKEKYDFFYSSNK